MIIKSHVRGGYRAAANYLRQQGENEKVRLVEISDTSAKNLDEAFRNMWVVGRTTRASKPLHHVSINPYKDERLTDAQVRKICERLEEKYGYRSGDHQRVIVEHIKDGRQHFRVMWNRVSLRTGRPVWPGHHWKKSKQAAREMEAELGLKRPVPRRGKKRTKPSPKTPARRKRTHSSLPNLGREKIRARPCVNRHAPKLVAASIPAAASVPVEIPGGPQRTGGHSRNVQLPAGLSIHGLLKALRSARAKQTVTGQREPNGHLPVRPKENSSVDELIAWAWENRRADILALFGIYVSFNL